MDFVKYGLLFILALFSNLVLAQSKCEYALLGDQPSSLALPTKKFLYNEFNRPLNNSEILLIDKLINRGEPATAQDKAEFHKILNYLKDTDARFWKTVENFLERKLSLEQAIALKFARGLGRNEKGKNNDLPAFSGNYTEQQMERKDRILELAGFTFEERAALIGNKFVEDVLTKYDAGNLLKDNVLDTPEQAVRMNYEVLEQMNQESAVVSPGKRQQALNDSEANELYEAVTRNPVARLLNVKKYDPTGQMGFCFGRAMTSHLEALQRGLAKESIRKVFVVGSMKAVMGFRNWQYHVATAVKRTEGGWWVIDPFFGKPVTIDIWYEKMYKQDTKGTLRLYVTEAARLGPNIGRYQRKHLMIDRYNGYFKELIKYYRLKARNELPEKSTWTKVLDGVLATLKIGF